MDGIDATLKKCDYCSFSFVGHAKYYNHARKDHSDIVARTWEACSKCAKRFPDKKALDKHCDRKHRHEKHVCHICCKEYVSKYRYILHANEKHKDIIKDTWEQCKTCLICYPDLKTLENHQQSAHLEDTYNYFHSESATEVCNFCLTPCSSKANYYQHVSTYHQDQVAGTWTKCDTCSMFFPDLPTLTMHKQSSHKKKGKSFKIMKNSRKVCKFCSYQYEDLEQFFDHANKKHPEAVRQTWLECNKCSKYYPERRTLYQHLRVHRDNNGTSNTNGTQAPNGNANTTTTIAWVEFSPSPQDSYTQSTPTQVNQTSVPQATILAPTIIAQPTILSQPQTQTLSNLPQVWPQTTVSIPTTTSSNSSDINGVTDTCFVCNEAFTVTQAYFHHANFKHREILAKTWHLCQVCMWYYPTEEVIRTHGCGVLTSTNGVAVKGPQNMVDPPTATAYAVYQPVLQRPQGTYSIIGLPTSVTMEEFYGPSTNSVAQVARDYITTVPSSQVEKSNYTELKNVTLNGWLESTENKPQIAHIIQQYPGTYL